VQACTAEQRRELDRRLRVEAGVTLDSLLTRRLARVAKLRAQGRLATEAQYYLVRERVEEVWDDPERAEEHAQLQAMVNAYEERVARRRPA
jgi:glycerol-3-phosphate dehydrogenase